MSASKVIIIRESLAKSIMRDAVTFGTMTAAIGLGVFLESAAMQWAGAICLFIIIIISRAAGLRKELTKSEALEFINEMED